MKKWSILHQKLVFIKIQDLVHICFHRLWMRLRSFQDAAFWCTMFADDVVLADVNINVSESKLKVSKSIDYRIENSIINGKRY